MRLKLLWCCCANSEPEESLMNGTIFNELEQNGNLHTICTEPALFKAEIVKTGFNRPNKNNSNESGAVKLAPALQKVINKQDSSVSEVIKTYSTTQTIINEPTSNESDVVKTALHTFIAKQISNVCDEVKTDSLPSITIKEQDSSESDVDKTDWDISNNSSASNKIYEFGKSTGRMRIGKVLKDNSCLFTSFLYLVFDGGINSAGKESDTLRQICANAVAKNPCKYNHIMLEQENEKYCEWIKDKKNWGGDFELEIISDYFEIEICVFNNYNPQCLRFGETKNYKNRCFIHYACHHYDPIYWEEGDRREFFFARKDEYYVDLARECVQSLSKPQLCSELDNSHLSKSYPSFNLMKSK